MNGHIHALRNSKVQADHLTLFLEAYISGQWLKTLDAHNNPKRAAENPLPEPVAPVHLPSSKIHSIFATSIQLRSLLGRFASFFSFHTSIWGCTSNKTPNEKCFERGARRVSGRRKQHRIDLIYHYSNFFIFLSARNWVSDCEFRGQINEFSATIHSSIEPASLEWSGWRFGGLEQQFLT